MPATLGDHSHDGDKWRIVKRQAMQATLNWLYEDLIRAGHVMRLLSVGGIGQLCLCHCSKKGIASCISN